MSSKPFDLSTDVATIVSSVNEVITVSSSIWEFDANVKFYSNIASSSQVNDLGGYFQTVYDASPTSSLSTPLFDLTFGYATGSYYNLVGSATSSNTEKTKIYRQMASLLLGNPDSMFQVNSKNAKEAFFVAVRRSMMKDELKKGSITVELSGSNAAGTSFTATITDTNAASVFKQAVGGDYAPLYSSASSSLEVGQVWYQAGVIVLRPNESFGDSGAIEAPFSGSGLARQLYNLMISGNINTLVDGFRNFTNKIDFHNQTNLHSSIFFCRAYNNEFNYSSNPTFVDDNQRIRVTSGSNVMQTRTYVTTIGLYDENDNLLATGKVNKPIVKSFENESIFRIRLDN
jgi:hypothetical protein